MSFHLGSRFSLIPAVDFDFVRRSAEHEVAPVDEETENEGGERWATIFVFGIKFAFSL